MLLKASLWQIPETAVQARTFWYFSEGSLEHNLGETWRTHWNSERKALPRRVLCFWRLVSQAAAALDKFCPKPRQHGRSLNTSTGFSLIERLAAERDTQKGTRTEAHWRGDLLANITCQPQLRVTMKWRYNNTSKTSWTKTFTGTDVGRHMCWQRLLKDFDVVIQKFLFVKVVITSAVRWWWTKGNERVKNSKRQKQLSTHTPCLMIQSYVHFFD